MLIIKLSPMTKLAAAATAVIVAISIATACRAGGWVSQVFAEREAAHLSLHELALGVARRTPVRFDPAHVAPVPGGTRRNARPRGSDVHGARPHVARRARPKDSLVRGAVA